MKNSNDILQELKKGSQITMVNSDRDMTDIFLSIAMGGFAFAKNLEIKDVFKTEKTALKHIERMLNNGWIVDQELSVFA